MRVLNDLWRARLSRRRMIWLLPHPSHSPVSKLSLLYTVFVCVVGRAYWRGKEGVGGRGRVKTYDGEKACSFINHSIFSALRHTPPPFPTSVSWLLSQRASDNFGNTVPVTTGMLYLPMIHNFLRSFLKGIGSPGECFLKAAVKPQRSPCRGLLDFHRSRQKLYFVFSSQEDT